MTGIDFSRKMLAKAKAKASKEKLIIKFKQGNITKKLPFKNDEFDAVLCALVFNHIKNIKPVFKEVARILKRNGTFVLSDLHPELRERRKYKIIAGEFAAPAYKHRFVDYFRAARSAGLEIYKITEGKVDKELAKLTRVGEGTLLLIVFKLKKEKRLK